MDSMKNAVPECTSDSQLLHEYEPAAITLLSLQDKAGKPPSLL